MKKTISEMFNETRIEAERNIRNNKFDTIVYLSGTINKKHKYVKLLDSYIADSNMDFELGVISKEIYEFEMKAAQIIKKSIDNFVVY